MSLTPDEMDQPPTDDGVPVGAADAERDRIEAGGDGDAGDDRGDDETFLAQAATEEDSDRGVPVGPADVDQDRLSSASGDESAI